MTLDEQLAVLRRGTTEIISEADLKAKLEKGRPLRVKLGVDPTARHVTLGWAVVLRKLRDFQRLGHQAVLVIGDFTAQIGDPSGKSKTRPQLTHDEVRANVESVLGQLGAILDVSKTEIVYNRDWLGKMTFEDVIRLPRAPPLRASWSGTTSASASRRTARSRCMRSCTPCAKATTPWRSARTSSSGGMTRKFNNLVGRTLQEASGQEPQTVVLSPLLVGTDGKGKDEPVAGNYIAVTDPPTEMYGKTMSVPDEVMENYFELATDVPMDEVRALLQGHPMEAKRRLAREIVGIYHGEDEGRRRKRRSRGPSASGSSPWRPRRPRFRRQSWKRRASLPPLVAALGLAKSRGDAKRLIEAGAVSLDGERPAEANARLAPRGVAGEGAAGGEAPVSKLV